VRNDARAILGWNLSNLPTNIAPASSQRGSRSLSDGATCAEILLSTQASFVEAQRAAMKGNKEVIDALNFALKLELGAVNQYWLHYRRLDDWGYTKIAKKEREESIEEMHHADKLITRIIFLEGFPKMQEIAPLMIGENLKEVLECDLKGEYIAQEFYTKARELCRQHKDYVSMDLFEELLKDEEGHIDFIETQLDLLKSIGIQNYGQLQADSADKVEGHAD
jgi:bacterioferritin